MNRSESMPARDLVRRTLWVASILTIFLFSAFGLALRRFVAAHLSLDHLQLVIGAVLLAAVVAWAVRYGRRLGWLWRAVVAAGGLYAAWYAVQMHDAVEAIHLLLFGVFGFLTLDLFGPWPGIAVCLALAGIDEALQGVIPGRVADWRDVGLNASAALGGGLLGWLKGVR